MIGMPCTLSMTPTSGVLSGVTSPSCSLCWTTARTSVRVHTLLRAPAHVVEGARLAALALQFMVVVVPGPVSIPSSIFLPPLLLSLLLRLGWLADARDSLGATPLILSVQHKQSLATLALLARGADVTIRDVRGAGVVHWAAYKGA